MAKERHSAKQGVYGISVAAELVGVGEQTLRLYERTGLVDPARTEGGTRRYSQNDVDRMRRIGELVEDGLNLAGVGKVLQLEKDNAALRRKLQSMEEQTRKQSMEEQTRKRDGARARDRDHPARKPRLEGIAADHVGGKSGR